MVPSLEDYGHLGNKMYLKAEGTSAKTSLSGKPTETFVIRVEPGTDPENVVGLYPFEVKRTIANW